LARAQPRGEKHLVAYVIVARPDDFSADTLKRYLANRLPHYMMPTWIVRLDRLPLTPNGKVDGAALPPPDRQTPLPAADAPLTNLEEQLTGLWRRILGCAVGAEENFFDLGGTSLQLIEAHAELTRMLGRQLPVTALFEHSTVRGLAGWLAGVHLEPAFDGMQ